MLLRLIFVLLNAAAALAFQESLGTDPEPALRNLAEPQLDGFSTLDSRSLFGLSARQGR